MSASDDRQPPVKPARSRGVIEEERRNTGRVRATFAVSEKNGGQILLGQAEDIAIGGIDVAIQPVLQPIVPFEMVFGGVLGRCESGHGSSGGDSVFRLASQFD